MWAPGCNCSLATAFSSARLIRSSIGLGSASRSRSVIWSWALSRWARAGFWAATRSRQPGQVGQDGVPVQRRFGYQDQGVGRQFAVEVPGRPKQTDRLMRQSGCVAFGGGSSGTSGSGDAGGNEVRAVRPEPWRYPSGIIRARAKESPE